MADELETPLAELFDADHSGLLRRVVRVIELDQGLPFIEALERVHDSYEYVSRSGDPTLGGVLKAVSRDDVEGTRQTLKLLEHRDSVVRRVYEQAAAPVMLDVETDEQGRVKMLDQPSAESAARDPDSDPAVILSGDPLVFERRLARIRKAQPGHWNGDSGSAADNGRERFREEDRRHATAGVDLVKTAEMPRLLETARQQALAVARKLDEGVEQTADKQQRLRLLDAQLAELGHEREEVADGPGGTSLKLLDGSAQATAEPVASAAAVTDEQREAQALVQRVQARMRELGRPQDDFLMTLEEVMAEDDTRKVL